MNENLYIARKKLPHKTLRVHSARYTQCIHVSSRKRGTGGGGTGGGGFFIFFYCRLSGLGGVFCFVTDTGRRTRWHAAPLG